MQRLLKRNVRLGYCFTPYQRLWLYNGAPVVAFYDTLGIRMTHFRLNHTGVRKIKVSHNLAQSHVYTSLIYCQKIRPY